MVNRSFLNPHKCVLLCSTTRMNLSGIFIFQIGIDKDGKIQYLKNTFYEDIGCSLNENEAPLETMDAFINCYEDKTWYVQSNSVLTDTPSNTWCRAPGASTLYLFRLQNSKLNINPCILASYRIIINKLNIRRHDRGFSYD